MMSFVILSLFAIMVSTISSGKNTYSSLFFVDNLSYLKNHPFRLSIFVRLFVVTLSHILKIFRKKFCFENISVLLYKDDKGICNNGIDYIFW